MKNQSRGGLTVLLLALTIDALAQAQYPTKSIRIIVPTSASSGPDFAARLMSQPLSERLGQQVVVENRAGAATLIGTEIVAKSIPDGHTLLMAPPAFAINPSLYKKVPYDPLRDFAPVMHTHTNPMVLAVHPSLPAKSVKELIAVAKARPGEIVFAHSGSGSITHMSMELFLFMSGTRMLRVTYKGPAPAVIDVVAGRVPVVMSGLPLLWPHIRAGKLRALGLSSAKRTAAMPDLPTIAEAGVPGYESVSWSGLFAPARTPPEIVARLNTEANAVLRAPNIRERFENEGGEVVAGSASDLAGLVRSETVKWAKVVKSAGIQPE